MPKDLGELMFPAESKIIIHSCFMAEAAEISTDLESSAEQNSGTWAKHAELINAFRFK